MKPGSRVLGVAESAVADDRSVLAGAVVRADRVVDGFGFEDCTVGGRDATDAVDSVFSAMDREDVQYVMLAGVALAWFNLVDLHRVREHADRPVLSVSFEASSGLAGALREQFSGDALEARLAVYESLPARERVTVDSGEEVWVRAAGCGTEEAREVVRAVTPAGGRPEPVRVARLAARGAARFLDA